MAQTGPRKLGGLALSTLLFIACTTGGGTSPSATGAAPTSGPASQAPQSASPAASADTGPSAEPTLGAAEQTKVTIGNWLPNAGSVAPLYVALDRGYFKDEGLDVEVLVVPETRAAVESGSIDLGILEIGQVAQAVNQGLQVQATAAYRCHRAYAFGVRPEIKTPADLSGKDILIEWTAGEPDGNARKVLLKEVGWDLDAISPPPNYVIIPGFSNAATKVFLAGKLYGMPLYPQTKAAVIDSGGEIILDMSTDWSSDVVFGKTDWIAKNPNTTARMLRAIMLGLADTLDTSQQSDILTLLKARGVPVEREEQTLAQNPDSKDVLTQSTYCANMSFTQENADDLFKAVQMSPMPDWDGLTNLEPLLAAQASLGLTNELAP